MLDAASFNRLNFLAPAGFAGFVWCGCAENLPVRSAGAERLCGVHAWNVCRQPARIAAPQSFSFTTHDLLLALANRLCRTECAVSHRPHLAEPLAAAAPASLSRLACVVALPSRPALMCKLRPAVFFHVWTCCASGIEIGLAEIARCQQRPHHSTHQPCIVHWTFPCHLQASLRARGGPRSRPHCAAARPSGRGAHASVTHWTLPSAGAAPERRCKMRRRLAARRV